MDSDIVTGTICGCLSSLIIWWVINIVLTPSLEIEDSIQYKGVKKFVRIRNKSWFNIYDVICCVEFRFDQCKEIYKRTDKPLPYLPQKHGLHYVNLSGDINTNRFFESHNDNSKLVITVTYQNKFGVRKTAKRCISLNEEG